MAAQATCVLDGLRPCRRRNHQRKKLRSRQHRSHGRGRGGVRSREDRDHENEDETDEEATMDEIWRRHQRQRLDRTNNELQMEPTTTSHYPSSIGGPGTHAVDMGGAVLDEHHHGDGSSSSTRKKKKRPSDELDGERLWEFVVGWCMIACVFTGIALILGANIAVQNNRPSAEETPWTFDQEEGDSLMDSIMTHVMKIALGIKDFEDQLMEHGIFIFVVGINGYLLVRQRVYGRRRQYEKELMQGDTLQLDMIRKGAAMAPVVASVSAPMSQDEEYGAATGQGTKAMESGDHEVSGIASRGYFEDAGYDEISKATAPWATFETDAFPPPVPPKDSPSSLNNTAIKERPSVHKTEIHDGDDENDDDDDTPDFRTMSFLAWFNYLQVGIVIIEFLQLFSFPLRELMEFYNQAAKTSTVYESAKDVLNAFRTVATTADKQHQESSSTDGLHYGDGKLSFGNTTLFGFNLNSANSTSLIENATANETTLELSQKQQAIDWLENMPMLDNATAATTPWIQESKVPMEWISDNLPAWLPNITALLANSSMATGQAQKSLEKIRDHIVQAAAVASANVAVVAQAVGNVSTAIGGLKDTKESNTGTSTSLASPSPTTTTSKDVGNDGDIVMQVVNSLGLQPSINTHDWYLLRFWSCFTVVILGWVVALSIHGWNRRCRRLRREGKPHWGAISVGWISCFIPVVSILYLPILSTFLSSASCQSQAIHAYAHERHAQQEDQARREGHGPPLHPSSILHSIVLTLLDPASTVSSPPAQSLLCTGPQVRPSLYLAASLLAYTLAYLLFMVFLTSFERVPAKGEICFRPNGVAVLKNLGLLLAVDFLLIQSPAQRRFRGLVSIAIMLAMACYTIRMKPCYWNKINYWRTFSFSCVMYASLLVALLCPSPEPTGNHGHGLEGKGNGGGALQGERIGGKWVMAPHLKMGHAWTVGGGPKVMLAWIAAGWAILIIVFIVIDRVFLRQWTKKNPWRSELLQSVNPSVGGSGGGVGGGVGNDNNLNSSVHNNQTNQYAFLMRPPTHHPQDRPSFQRDPRRPSLQPPPAARPSGITGTASTLRGGGEDFRLPTSSMGPKTEFKSEEEGDETGYRPQEIVAASSHWSIVDLATPGSENPPRKSQQQQPEQQQRQ
ncbi:hypothetical protein BGZ83_009968 [Gryganskiella cystojenkinii]|nr:hypothetical protein BGZ83_009968 [Gryganskiella cystojenkinii]